MYSIFRRCLPRQKAVLAQLADTFLRSAADASKARADFESLKTRFGKVEQEAKYVNSNRDGTRKQFVESAMAPEKVRCQQKEATGHVEPFEGEVSLLNLQM